jgi:hypothetical protein
MDGQLYSNCVSSYPPLCTPVTTAPANKAIGLAVLAYGMAMYANHIIPGTEAADAKLNLAKMEVSATQISTLHNVPQHIRLIVQLKSSIFRAMLTLMASRGHRCIARHNHSYSGLQLRTCSATSWTNLQDTHRTLPCSYPSYITKLRIRWIIKSSVPPNPLHLPHP